MSTKYYNSIPQYNLSSIYNTVFEMEYVLDNNEGSLSIRL